MSDYIFDPNPKDVTLVQTDHRSIQTQIPCPGTVDELSRISKVESRSMQGQLPIVWDKAVDFSVYDRAGNKWIDFTSTIFVANIGHSNQRLKDRIIECLDKDLVSSYAYVNRARIEYIEKLVRFAGSGFEKAFLLSAGTEATEAAVKIMRLNGIKNAKRRLGVVSISGNWHGRTYGAQMLSSNEAQSNWIPNKDPDICHIPFPYPWTCSSQEEIGRHWESCIEILDNFFESLDKDVCGIMLETFQGWAAAFYPSSFVRALRELADKNNILLCFDEMQSGFGRTGRKFGYEHYGVRADLIACGKGMGGGVPISGLIGSASVMDLPDVGNMSSTHSANPLVCSAAMAVLEEIEEKNLVEESERKGKILHEKLRRLRGTFPEKIAYTLGKGLIASVIFIDSKTGEPQAEMASWVSERCMQMGLLVVHTGIHSIKIGPPLTISDDALLEGLVVLESAIRQYLAK